MAEYKKNILALSTGRQIKLFGTCIGISKTLEIAEAYAPNILATAQGAKAGQVEVQNPLGLTAEEIHEIADYHIRLWMDLKEAVRKHGVASGKIFKGMNG